MTLKICRLAFHITAIGKRRNIPLRQLGLAVVYGWMRRFFYIALRAWPVKIGAAIAGAVGLWGTLDANSARKTIIGKIANLDFERTGWLILGLIGVWLLALWLTRNWSQSDRDYYKGELQHPYVEHQNLFAAFRNLNDEGELADLVTHAGNRMEATANFINDELGSAAVSKYGSGQAQFRVIAWEGDYTEEGKLPRTAWMLLLSLRLENLEHLLNSGAWDDPRPVHGRLAASRWRKRKELVWKKLSQMRALTPCYTRW